ncbi:MAG: flagellar basal-body rod protein FlgF [Firmicutes bacterium]|nr:flagellar basal-body rod protein FlgF [Bacillota bacterium]
MIRGLYTAASGMMAQVVRQETIGNNLANSDTVGFKQDLTILQTGRENDVVRIPQERLQRQEIIGSMDLGVLVSLQHTSFAQGPLQETGQALDLAITGNGFFTVETPEGMRYTRNGAFNLDAERFLVTAEGDRVLGVLGPVQLPEGEVQIAPEGQILVNGQLIDTLRLVEFADPGQLQKTGSGYWSTEQAELDFNGQVQQGYLEGANVQPAEEMARMVAVLRLYETNQRVLQAHDQLTGKIVNEIGI